MDARSAFPDEPGGILGWQGLAEEKASHEIALVQVQIIALGFGLTPFSDHLQAEIVRQRQGGGADLGIARVGFDIADEGPVQSC